MDSYPMSSAEAASQAQGCACRVSHQAKPVEMIRKEQRQTIITLCSQIGYPQPGEFELDLSYKAANQLIANLRRSLAYFKPS
jgi:hypothetical protein